MYRRLIVVVALLGSATVRAEFIDDIRDGSEAFATGDFGSALGHFQSAETERPEDPRLQYNIGGAAYELGDYEMAEDYFTKALATTDVGLEAKTHYNLGNTYFRMQDYPKAITSFEEALKLDPDDVNAKINLELARRMLKENSQPQQGGENQQQQNQEQSEDQQSQGQQEQEEEQQQDQQQGEGEDESEQQQEGEENQDQPDQQQQQEMKEQQISKEDAERILNALRDDEREIQDRMKRQIRGTGDYIGKDW